ncbi:MAG: ribosome biogenesis/translation initiation ATPase RLI [Thermoplasmata archaeon]|nr:ribosome biogenesis/translation initiation ATPase RLI [Euryarchaeota archaeon]MVT35255.1 ribosome biogenesis/translation initiation ATPase RLI [Euryarchaeota archaeon]
MHIAVIIEDLCHPKKCQHECQYYCPPQRMGEKVVEFGENGFPTISEKLCIGCGICAHKCPYQAIRIIGLPEELKEENVHQYSENGFRLYRLPSIKKGIPIGILGQNGLGKSTAINILSGFIIPNLGNFNSKIEKDDVISHFKGTIYADYFRNLYSGKIRVSTKPQYVDIIPKLYKGKVNEILSKVESSTKDLWIEKFHLENIMEREIEALSGGELQSLALATTLMKEADIYFFDEPSSYLDIKQRLEFSKIIMDVAKKSQVYIVEHDLAILDFLAEEIHILYGTENAFGVVSRPLSTRHAINSYLSGFIKEENIKIRDWNVQFFIHPPAVDKNLVPLISWTEIVKRYPEFTLRIMPGRLLKSEVVGVVGPNATGKTTFVKILAGVEKQDSGEIDSRVKVSYKPQYIKFQEGKSVLDIVTSELKESFDDPFFKNEIWEPLNLRTIQESNVSDLAGGEMQLVAIALCLGRNADVFLLDEPSAYLDSSRRISVAKIIRRFIEKTKKTALVVDHDVYFIDLVSDSLMVFEGTPGVEGIGTGPYNMREGMNRFLKNVGITFRRDENTKRPRINKPDSYNDREQKNKGEYYYL